MPTRCRVSKVARWLAAPAVSKRFDDLFRGRPVFAPAFSLFGRRWGSRFVTNTARGAGVVKSRRNGDELRLSRSPSFGVGRPIPAGPLITDIAECV